MRRSDGNKFLGLFLVVCLLGMGALAITACSESSTPTEPGVEDESPGPDPTDPGTPDDSGDADDDGSTDTDPTVGSLQISMTDAPTDEICNLVVFIEDLRVKKDGSPAQILGTGAGIGEYDLLELQNGEQVLLGDFEVEQGLYQFIEMLLNESQSYVVEKIDPVDDVSEEICPDPLDPEFHEPLKIPSAKFKINGGPFEVDDLTRVLIDFDAKNSLKVTGNGKTYQLKADVSIDQVDP